MRAVHLTSVHSPVDPRVALKECATLAALGYEVVLVAPHDGTRPPHPVRLRPVPPPRGRLRRMTLTAARVTVAALAARGDVYHVHDPELLPWALLLRLTGRPVVYDVHEDYVTSLRQKPYLPRPVRAVLARAWDTLERLLSRPLTVVLAERYYAERFPAGVLVLNYPLPSEPAAAPAPSGPRPAPPEGAPRRLLYTGNVTVDRGALLHVRLLATRPDLELVMVGRCSPELAARLRLEAGPGASRLLLRGEGRFVPFEEIRSAYAEAGWLCGLAVFPPTPHYERKELTKFFEYMAAGLPVVCSDFPRWRALVADQGAGICVDPGDPTALEAALDRLTADPAAARSMGERGRDLVRTHYTWESQGRRLGELYERLQRR